MSEKHYRFSGHAIGAAARFHRLDEVENLNHVIPTLGASVLPVTGGRSEGHVDHYCFAVDHPRRRRLLVLQRVDTWATGKALDDRFETETEVDIEGVEVVEKLHVARIKLHLLAARDARSEDGETVVSTKGTAIDGLELGRVKAKVVMDDEPIAYCGSQDQLAAFYRRQSAAYRSENAYRFRCDPAASELAPMDGRYRFSLVRKIELSGTQDPEQPVTVDGYSIRWKGFGRIILGEVFIKGSDRRITMMRLAMGSDAGGDGTVGDGGSNGHMGN